MPIHYTVCQEADKLVRGERQDTYDHPFDNFTRIGKIWGLILETQDPIPPEKVALMMCGVKLAREIFKHHRDNTVDLAGYAQALEMVHERKEELSQVNDNSISKRDSHSHLSSRKSGDI